jgi:SAM-dependent methyltransferase
MADHDYDIDWAEHAEHLSRAARTNAGWYASMAAELVRPTDRLLADVGCGGAGMAAALASTAAPDAEVVAVDGNEEILAAARENLARAGVASRVRLARADLTGGQAGLAAVLTGTADLIWASAVVHHAGDQQVTVDILTGMLAPGGQLALAEGGLRARHLRGTWASAVRGWSSGSTPRMTAGSLPCGRSFPAAYRCPMAGRPPYAVAA